MSFTIFLFIIFGIGTWLFSFYLDTNRIKNDLDSRGCKLLSKKWLLFGKGWFGEKNDRIYKVTYLDRDENKHTSFVKTSLFSGVYFSDDTITRYSEKFKEQKSAEEQQRRSLEQENARFKKELEAFKTKS